MSDELPPAPTPAPAELAKRAEAALARGEAEPAAALYGAALARDPAPAGWWYNLAWALRAGRRFDEALAAYDAALARGVARPEEVRVNRAAILSEQLGRTDLALAEFDQALALHGDYVPALLGAGLLHEDLGDLDAARAAYTRAAVAAPGRGRAPARLAALACAGGDAAGAVRGLEAALAGAAGGQDRAELLFALGGALDQLGRYDQAFAAVEAANWLARAAAPRRYDPRRQEELVDRLIAAFATGVPAAPPTNDEATSPLFLCGMFRSGSTLAERLLARHPAVAPGGELDAIPALAARLAPYPEAAARLSPPALAAERRRYRERLPRGRPFATDKRCDNVFHLGLVRQLFPAAPIVHTVRHPLDNLLSIYFLDFGEEVSYGHDLLAATHHYVQYRRLVRHWRERAGIALVDLDYDRLVQAPAATMARLAGDLGLAWDDALLAGPAPGGAIRTPSALGARGPLHARSSGRWRHYARQLDPCRRLLTAAGL